MKIVSLVCVVIAFLFLEGCRKKDSLDPMIYSDEVKFNKTGNQTSWTTVNNWKETYITGTTIYYSKVPDQKNIHKAFNGGLVLVYKETDDGIKLLPFEEVKAAEKIVWNYQVSNQAITILCKGHLQKPEVQDRFCYLILSANKMKALEKKGYSKEYLLKLKFDQVYLLEQDL